MKEYDKEEKRELLNLINKIQKIEFNYKKEDEEFKLKSKWHTKEDIIEAKTIRNKKKL